MILCRRKRVWERYPVTDRVAKGQETAAPHANLLQFSDCTSGIELPSKWQGYAAGSINSGRSRQSSSVTEITWSMPSAFVSLLGYTLQSAHKRWTSKRSWTTWMRISLAKSATKSTRGQRFCLACTASVSRVWTDWQKPGPWMAKLSALCVRRKLMCRNRAHLIIFRPVSTSTAFWMSWPSKSAARLEWRVETAKGKAMKAHIVLTAVSSGVANVSTRTKSYGRTRNTASLRWRISRSRTMKTCWSDRRSARRNTTRKCWSIAAKLVRRLPARCAWMLDMPDTKSIPLKRLRKMRRQRFLLKSRGPKLKSSSSTKIWKLQKQIGCKLKKTWKPSSETWTASQRRWSALFEKSSDDWSPKPRTQRRRNRQQGKDPTSSEDDRIGNETSGGSATKRWQCRNRAVEKTNRSKPAAACCRKARNSSQGLQKSCIQGESAAEQEPD